jgi:hypothetical protein
VEDNRAFSIAFLARRFVLLADRPELCVNDRAERIERLLNLCIPLSEIDRTACVHASELDHVCVQALRILRKRSSKSLLDGLGIMDADRVCALYYALPERRRKPMLRDPVWAYDVSNAPPGMEQAINDLRVLADDLQVTQAAMARNCANAEGAIAARRLAEQCVRNALRMEVCLPVDLSDGEKQAHVLGIFEDELAALADEPDDVDFAAALDRAVRRSAELA